MSPVPSFGGLPPYPSFEDVVNKVNRLVNELRNLLLTLDSLNVVSLTADHVDAGTLDAGKVTVHVDYSSGASITLDKNGIKINNGSFDTFVADVNGEVTATAITIQSATGYPKIVMDPQGNLLGAYSDADSYVALKPVQNGAPAFVIYDNNSVKGIIQDTNGDLVMISASGEDIDISSGGNLGLGSVGDTHIDADGNLNLDPFGSLQINGTDGYTGNISYVKNVTSDGMGNVFVSFGTLNFTKGILTSAT